MNVAKATQFSLEAANIFVGAPGLFNIINLALLQNIKLLLLLLEKRERENVVERM